LRIIPCCSLFLLPSALRFFGSPTVQQNPSSVGPPPSPQHARSPFVPSPLDGSTVVPLVKQCDIVTGVCTDQCKQSLLRLRSVLWLSHPPKNHEWQGMFVFLFLLAPDKWLACPAAFVPAKSAFRFRATPQKDWSVR